jgi:DNA-binding beta-propeller fold protein YncE
MYEVLGTGYDNPEDVKVTSDGQYAYVTERSGDLVKVALASADRLAATVVASGMNAPQQLFLDENGGAAYTVEYAPSGRLLRIDLATGAVTAVLSGLQNAVGVVLSADRQYAYISEQTTGSDLGRVSQFQLSNGLRTGLATGLTSPFFLTWSDASQTMLLVPERDPVNLLTSVNVITNAVQTVASGLPFRLSSVAVASVGTLLVCCDQVIDEVTLPGTGGSQPDGPLLEGIGFVPFNTTRCRWTATSAPTCSTASSGMAPSTSPPRSAPSR